jgi:hypothetical protein
MPRHRQLPQGDNSDREPVRAFWKPFFYSVSGRRKEEETE